MRRDPLHALVFNDAEGAGVDALLACESQRSFGPLAAFISGGAEWRAHDMLFVIRPVFTQRGDQHRQPPWGRELLDSRKGQSASLQAFGDGATKCTYHADNLPRRELLSAKFKKQVPSAHPADS